MSMIVLILLIAALFIWRPWSMDRKESRIGSTDSTSLDRGKQDEEFGEEFGEDFDTLSITSIPIEIPVSDSGNSDTQQMESGVRVKGNQEVTILYNGLLKNDGADGILLHHGKDGWTGTRDDWMEKDSQGTFTIRIKNDASNELNFCFKDSADHYDDNNSWNWSIK